MKATLSANAKADLREIEEYIAKDNPKAAKKVGQEIRSKIFTVLCHTPYASGKYEGTSHDIRVSYVRNYGIYYRVTSKLEIVRILHQKRNINSILH